MCAYPGRWVFGYFARQFGVWLVVDGYWLLSVVCCLLCVVVVVVVVVICVLSGQWAVGTKLRHGVHEVGSAKCEVGCYGRWAGKRTQKTLRSGSGSGYSGGTGTGTGTGV
jgi:hypothetical protein